MVHWSGAKLWEEDLDAEELQVLDNEGPEVEDVVPGDVRPLLEDDGVAAEQVSML